MSSSLSTMPFSRQYGSFRVTSTTAGNGNAATTTTTASNAASGVHLRHARHSSGNDSAGLQMAPLSYRVGNLARNVSNNWLNNSSRNQNTRTGTYAPLQHHQQKQTHYHHHAAPSAQQEQQDDSVVRCTVHRAGPVKQQPGEPIADTPLLQSPRIIARSTAARLVEPNAWNRRLTTSNFCALSSGANASSSRLLCRKSPGSSGTSVESIVPKYSRPAATTTTTATTAATPRADSTTAQKRTYNAHKPQLRVTNTSGRIGTVAKKLTGGGDTTHPTAATSTPSAAQNAQREVAMVLHHHNMRVVDMLNNNHLQQQQTSRTTARAVKENNENYQPGQKQLSGVVTKKGFSGIPQRLPLADRDQPTTERNKRLQLAGGNTAESSFSSKFPNGLPFEQEFYYRRPPEVGDGGLHRQDPGSALMPEKAEDENDEQHKHHQHHPLHQQRIRNGTKKNVLLPRRGGGGRGVEHQVPSVPHRSRSVSGEMNETSPPPQDQRRSVSGAADRLPDDEDALYVDFTKRCEPEQADNGGGETTSPQSLLQTSVVEYRNINHSSYYYKFESVSQRAGRCRYQRARLGLNRPAEPVDDLGTMATDINGNGAGHCEYYDDGEGDEQFNADQQGELEEEDGERSTVYVAVATWVPKCNRLPNESSEHNNAICLTLAADRAAQRQQQQHHRPTRIAVAAAPKTPPPAQIGRTAQHTAAKKATAAPSSYSQL